MFTSDERVVMRVNDLQCAFHMPPALMPKFHKKEGHGIWTGADSIEERGEEIVQNLPPGAPRFAFSVDEYPGCPSTWMHGSSKASSYWLPARPGCGMWLDFNYNYNHSHHVAVVVSIQGINPITGQKTSGLRLEQYREKCPIHNTAFGQNRFCEECGHEWDSQNYISSNITPHGLFWIDGFRGGDGVVRQYVFTEETCKGVAAGIIGEDRVFAIGVAFYLSKEPKAAKALAPEIAAHAHEDVAAFQGYPPSHAISPSVRINESLATFKRISIPLERKHTQQDLRGSGPAIPTQITVDPSIIPSTIQCSVPDPNITLPSLVMPCMDTPTVLDPNSFVPDANWPKTSNPYDHIAKGGTLHDSIPANKNSRDYSRLELCSSSGHSLEMKDGFPSDDATSLQQMANGSTNLDVFYTTQYDATTGKEYNMDTGEVVDFASSPKFESVNFGPAKKTLEFAPGEKVSPSEIGHDLKERTPEEIEQEMKKLEITAGARIKQRIFQDPESPEFWQTEPAGFIYINYCNIDVAEKIMAAGRQRRSGSYMDSLALS